jgi:hypothetical protein
VGGWGTRWCLPNQAIHAATHFGVECSRLPEMQKKSRESAKTTLAATFLPNTLSFALALFPPPDLVLPTMPSALSLFVFESLAANFTCFSFVAGGGIRRLLRGLEDSFGLRLFSPCGFAFIGAESFAPSGGFGSRFRCGRRFGRGALRGSDYPPYFWVKEIKRNLEKISFRFLGGRRGLRLTSSSPSIFCGNIRGCRFFGSGFCRWRVGSRSLQREADFLVEAADFFFFFTGSSSDSRARFFPSSRPRRVVWYRHPCQAIPPSALLLVQSTAPDR